jgi:hypothetical protein
MLDRDVVALLRPARVVWSEVWRSGYLRCTGEMEGDVDMVQVSVDYEGRSHKLEADADDTHVVASFADGELRLQATDTPAETMAAAQQSGGEDCRVATIDDRRAVFTPVPEYDPREREVEQRDHRSKVVQYSVAAAILAAIVVVVLLL